MVHSSTEEFDWDAFMRDTFEASSAATGAWLRCLYKMRLSVTRGRISWPVLSYARLFGTTVDQAKAVIDELSALGIGDAVTEANGNITLINRRMYRAWEAQEANRIRQLRFRQNHVDDEKPKSNGHITAMSRTPHISLNSSSSSSEKEVNTERIKTKKYVEEVFAYWQSILNHPNAKLTKDKRAVIKARLDDGYTVEEIKKAINGCKASSYHMGVNEHGKVYDGLDLICRNGSKLEQFIGYLKASPNNSKPFDAGKDAVFESKCPDCGDANCNGKCSEARAA